MDVNIEAATETTTCELRTVCDEKKFFAAKPYGG